MVDVAHDLTGQRQAILVAIAELRRVKAPQVEVRFARFRCEPARRATEHSFTPTTADNGLTVEQRLLEYLAELPVEVNVGERRQARRERTMRQDCPKTINLGESIQGHP